MFFPEEFDLLREEEDVFPPLLEVLLLACVFLAVEEVLFFFAVEDEAVFPEFVFFFPDAVDDAIDQLTPLQTHFIRIRNSR